MPLSYNEFVSLRNELGLNDRQSEFADEYNVKKTNMFNISDENEDKLWQTYFRYKDLIKSVHKKIQHNDELLDPHKIASCLTLSILSTRAFILDTDAIKITDNRITKSISETDEKFLLNELFAFRCGFIYLKYAMIRENKDINIKKKISDFTLNYIPVNRYDKVAEKLYLDYAAYNLRHIWEIRTPSHGFLRADVLNLAGTFHHIENYVYLHEPIN